MAKLDECAVMALMNKKLKLKKVLNNILNLEVSKGHLKWKVSDLSRKTGMSRPLIYYHLGKTKKAILEKCLEIIAEEVYGLNRSLPIKTGLHAFADELVATQKNIQAVPALTIFYLRCRSGNSPLQKRFVEIEQNFHRKILKHCPYLKADQAVAMHSLLFGIVSAPFTNEEGVRKALRLIRS